LVKDHYFGDAGCKVSLLFLEEVGTQLASGCHLLKQQTNLNWKMGFV